MISFKLRKLLCLLSKEEQLEVLREEMMYKLLQKEIIAGYRFKAMKSHMAEGFTREEEFSLITGDNYE